jgi:hypothetical protein
MSPFDLAAAFGPLLIAPAAALYLYRSHRTKARSAVTALCLVCSHTDTRKDRSAANRAGNMHGDKTGHPLVLVQGSPATWKRTGGPA